MFGADLVTLYTTGFKNPTNSSCTFILLSHPHGGARRRDDPRLILGFFVCVKGSHHLVFWSLGTLTGLSDILRQETGYVKERY